MSSFLNKQKKKNKEVLKKWVPDLYGAVDINSPIIVNTEMDGILTDPIKNYLRALLKHYSLSSTLMMDIILDYIGRHPFSAPLVLSERLTSCSFSSDYRYLVTLGSKTIKVWLLQRGICVRILKASTIIAVRIATNGEFIVASNKQPAFVWDVLNDDSHKASVNVWFPQDKQKYALSYEMKTVQALAISSNNLHVGTVSEHGSYVIMWMMKNNNELVRMWSHAYSDQSEPQFGPACEFFNDNTQFCAGNIRAAIILFSVRDGTSERTCHYQISPRPFTFFSLFPASSQIFIGEKQDFVSLLDLNEEGQDEDRQTLITRCRKHQLYPLELLPTSSGLVGSNIAKVMFLMMDQMVKSTNNPLKFSERWSKEWIIRTLSPSGRYCVLHQYKKQHIQVVSIDELIQSFDFLL